MNTKRTSPQSDLTQEAYTRISEAIREGTLSSGARVTEADLSKWLAMSRTPVREAIYRLESEGLLTHEPRRGLIVARPDHQMVTELYMMREVMEGAAARLAAQHASDTEIEALAELVSSARRHSDDPREFSQINYKFHKLICLSAHNRYLLRSLETTGSTLALLPRLAGTDEEIAEWNAQHMKIFEAIRERDPYQAESAARAHVQAARKRQLEILLFSESE